MASTAILAAAGLVTSPNELNRPDGSLSEASNVVIKRDGIIEQRRGFATYGTSFPSASQRAKQITSYRERILRHYSNKLQFDSNGLGKFFDIDGSVVETETGLRIRFIESNGNLYFTTQEGIKKLSAKNAQELNSIAIENSGAEKALDIQAKIKITDGLQTGFLPQDSKVAYRLVWNKEDNNANLITGTPSQRAEVTLSQSELIVRDTMRLLQTLDELNNTTPSLARIDNGDYLELLKLQLSSTPGEIRANLILLAEKLDNDITLANELGTAPVKLTGAGIDNGVGTITFEMVEAANLAALESYLQALPTIDRKKYIVYKATDSSIIYKYIGDDGSSNPQLIPGNILSDYFSPGLNIRLSGFDLGTRPEIQKITFSAIPTTGNFTLKYQGNESPTIAFNASLATVLTTLQKVTGLEQLETATGGTNATNQPITLTFLAEAGNLDQILNGPTNTLLDGLNPVSISGSTIQNGIANTEGDLNTGVTIVTVFENTITFNTDVVGVVNLSSAEIKYNEFRSITEPQETVSPTPNYQLTEIQNYLDNILLKLQSLPDSILAQGDDADSITDIDLTTTATVEVSFTVPSNVTTNDFYQLYRSTTAQAIDTTILDDLETNDEMKLVFEAYPTQEEIDNREITILDETTDIFKGANLYTNASTGEGILQANDQAPFAKDINRYRNSIFYANTRTKHRYSLNVLGVQNMIENFTTNGIIPKITITNGTVTNTYSFVKGERQIVGITVNSDNAGDILNGKYFKLYSPNNKIFVLYFESTTAINPATGDEIGVKIEIQTGASTSDIAKAISNKISTLLDDFTTTYSTNIVKIQSIEYGYTQGFDVGDITTELTFILTDGVGEGGTNVLLSPAISAAQAIDETAKSLVRIINKNIDESVYAFYTSGVDDAPGKIFLESRILSDIDPFYILANNSITGTSFNPDISPDTEINLIELAGSKTEITTVNAHKLNTGDQVVLSSTNSIPSIDGIHTITKINDTKFSIDFVVTSNGDKGSCIRKAISFVSENEQKTNRVYYSKFNEPESVPIVNYFDLGSSDKSILRIVPLRDSLFVFKEDGLFRISGDSAPFQSELFDNSFILSAPDSVDVCNNVIYAWTTQGIQALTEGGASVISRNIDNIILKTQSNNFTNFKTATWGLGYESDNSYIVFTVKNQEDTEAQIAYRYSTITNTWTTYDKSYTCGHIADFDDHFYAGASDIAYIEKERKTFSRLDYADREFTTFLSSSKILGKKIQLPIVSDFSVGDVLIQNQTISVYEFNQLLNKLDLDSGPSFNQYFNDLKMKIGDSPRTKLLDLANELDNDANIIFNGFVDLIENKSGTISLIDIGEESIITSVGHGLLDGRIIQISSSDSLPSIDGQYTVSVIDEDTFKITSLVKTQGTSGIWLTVDNNFDDLKVCYNSIIDKLNNDNGVNFNNYRKIDKVTLQEVIITSIDRIKRELTVNVELPFIVGEAIVYKAIETAIQYSPNTFGDPLNLKHLRESTLMFETRTLTSGILSFATDLLPEFIKIPFNLDGNGIFGHQVFGENFFGGLSNSAPFRTYIPRQCQRCRFIIAKFSHTVAREDWRLLGMTVTGEVSRSTRAFR